MNVQIAHPLPKRWVRSRLEHLEGVASGRRVLHLGCTDSPQMGQVIARGEWLHARLLAVAADVCGVDIDDAAVSEARQRFPDHTFIVGDISDEEAIAGAVAACSPDLIVMSEVIEHLASPAAALSAIGAATASGVEMVVTTPNAFGARRLLHALLRDVEIVHPDHRAYFSSYTLAALLEDSGWRVTSELTHRVDARWPSRVVDALLARAAPQCLPGLIAHAVKG